MSELIKALLKYRLSQTPENKNNVLEEMADVGIMLDQLRIIYGDETMLRKAKLERLKKRMTVYNT